MSPTPRPLSSWWAPESMNCCRSDQGLDFLLVSFVLSIRVCIWVAVEAAFELKYVLGRTSNFKPDLFHKRRKGQIPQNP